MEKFLLLVMQEARTIGLDQIIIGLFGATAVNLSQDRRRHVQRWACWLGLCAQPAWFYTTFMNHQWGIFALSFYYTWSWAKGVNTYWGASFREKWREFMYAEVWPTMQDPLAQRKPRLKIMDWVRR